MKETLLNQNEANLRSNSNHTVWDILMFGKGSKQFTQHTPSAGNTSINGVELSLHVESDTVGEIEQSVIFGNPSALRDLFIRDHYQLLHRSHGSTLLC